MTYLEERADAEAEVARLRTALASAEAKLQALIAQAVKPGIDVSDNQGDIDWVKVATTCDFAFIRVADGDVRDPRFTAARINAIRAAGLTWGPYYFGRVASAGNSERNGKSEAAMAIYFAEAAGALKKGDLPLAYDFETLNSQTTAKAASQLIDFVRTYQFIKGHLPIIYTGPAFMASVLPSISATDKALLALCPLWVAHWGVDKPTVPAPWSSWTFWQTSSQGTNPGMAGAVDTDVYANTKDQLAALRIQ